jgi:hypothetical protein
MRLGRRVLATTVMLVVAAGVSVAGAPSAYAAVTESSATLLFQSRYTTDGCLDLPSSGAVRMADCAYPALLARQLIRVATTEWGGYWLVGSNGKCISVEGYSTSEDAPLVQGTCTSNSSKRWYLDDHGDAVSFRNVRSGFCMRDSSGGPSQRACSGDFGWLLSPAGTDYNLRAKHSGKCLDVDTWPSGGLADGTRIQQWECQGPGQSNQLWHLEIMGLAKFDRDCYYCSSYFVPARYYLRPQHNIFKCLNHNQGYLNGARPVLGPCEYHLSLWYLFPMDLTPENQSLMIAPEHFHAAPLPVLDVRNDSGGGYANGTPVQLWEWYGSGQWNQLWQPIQVAW